MRPELRTGCPVCGIELVIPIETSAPTLHVAGTTATVNVHPVITPKVAAHMATLGGDGGPGLPVAA